MVGFEFLHYSLAIITGLLVGYYTIINILYFWSNRNERTNFSSSRSRKFAVVLFAEDQIDILSRSLYSLSGVIYPKNKYDLIVIAREYSPEITQIAEKMGAKMLIPPNLSGINTKGEVSAKAMAYILQDDDYDAIIMLNYDSLISGNYLEAMNYYLDQGNEVVQTARDILPGDEELEDYIYRIEYWINNTVLQLGRKLLGLEAAPKNNGICFSTDVLHEFQWRENIMENTFEYGLYLQLQGVEVAFAPEAEVFTDSFEEKKRFDNNGFNFRILRRYGLPFFGTFLKNRSLKYLDTFFFLTIPRFSFVLLFVSIMVLIYIIFWSLALVQLPVMISWITFAALGFGGLSLVLSTKGIQKNMLKIMPKYVFTAAKTIFKGIGQWKRNKHLENPPKKSSEMATVNHNEPVQ